MGISQKDHEKRKIKSENKPHYRPIEAHYALTAMQRDAEIMWDMVEKYGAHSPEFLNVAHLMSYSGLNATQAIDLYFQKMKPLHEGDNPTELTIEEERDMLALLARKGNSIYSNPQATLDMLIERIKRERKE